MELYVLYGMPGSLYTGKVRCYLRQRGLPFIDRPVGDPRFAADIVPRVGRFIMPVLVTPEGEVIQDGSVILDALEQRHPPERPIFPADPVLRTIAHLFELFGGEGLLRPAMHYRWNFDDDNLDFLREDFASALAPRADRAEQRAAVFERASARMRGAKAAFGVSEATVPAIEAAYLDFLRLFSAHLEVFPYLLGDHPTAADYALFGPLMPHLARDPYPSALMKRVAPRVFRWTERMQAPEGDAGDGLLDPRAMPATLRRLMAFIAEDYLPEIAAHVAYANQWLDARPDLAGGEHGIERPPYRSIGMASLEWRGIPIAVTIMPYRLWLLQRLQAAADTAPAEARVRIETLFAETGLSSLLTLRTVRQVERRGHLEVWGVPAHPG